MATTHGRRTQLAAQVICVGILAMHTSALRADDCNQNGVDDVVEIAKGQAADINANGTPDGCEGAVFAWDIVGPAELRDRPGSLLEAEYRVRLTSSGNLEGRGLQGWSISIAAENLRIVSGSSRDTVGADIRQGPPGLRDGGFERIELGADDTHQGIVSALVFSWTRPIATPVDRPSNLLRFQVEVEAPNPAETRTARFLFHDGLIGSSLPVDNRATRDGQTFRPYHEDRNVIVSSETRPFRRGDVNDDGTIDISDSISLLNFLFLGGTPPTCFDAADADDTGKLDLTDAIFVTAYLFLGRVVPTAPGPSKCGPDPSEDALDCLGPSACE